MGRSMIRRSFAFFILCYTISTATAQVDNIYKDYPISAISEGRPTKAIPGSHVLRHVEKQIQAYLRTHPESQPEHLLKRSASWGFQVGDTRAWWATDLVLDEEYQVPSTCRAVGQHCYIFVEDALWESGGNGRVTQAAVDSVKDVFDERTPADPTKGIYQIVVETFGDPPDVDSDPRIIILILDIIDGYTGTGGYIGGYFGTWNEYPDGSLAIGGRRSNQAEIYYVDANPGNLTTTFGLESAMLVTAHEFQHMIHWAHDWNEMVLVNEGCSEIASVVCGYPLRTQTGYLDETNIYLFQWRTYDLSKVLNDYARASRWTLYLKDQFSNDFLKRLVDADGNGINGINQALASDTPSTPRRFIDVLEDWMLANYINDPAVNPAYAYTYDPVPQVNPTRTHQDPNVPSTSESVQNLGAQYITFSGGLNLSVTFTSSASSLLIKAVKIGSTVVEDVPLNTPYHVSDFGTTFSQVTFVLINKHQTSSAAYTYSATGTLDNAPIELAYDDGQPEGYLPLSPNDTMVVHFGGVANTRLETIDIAFLQPGTIKMGINCFAGIFSATPVGQPLIPPFDVECTTTVSSFPYPVPYDNWVTVDFTQQNINASSDFVIWLVVGNDASRPGVMVSSEPDDGIYHSYTYLQDRQNWFILGDSDQEGHIFKYLIHSTLRLITDVPETACTAPTQFDLYPNYPNPFNPRTSIPYSLPEDTRVSVRVYDVSGRAVKTLIDIQQTAGLHTVTWDGRDEGGRCVSSGIYFIRLEAGDFRKVRKITLVR